MIFDIKLSFKKAPSPCLFKLDHSGRLLDNLLDTDGVLVLLLVERPHRQPQEHAEADPPVAGELAGAVLAVVDVKRLDLEHEVAGDREQRGVVGPRLAGLQAAVRQARQHRRGEAGQTHRGLLPELDRRGLHPQDDVIVLILNIIQRIMGRLTLLSNFQNYPKLTFSLLPTINLL